MNANEQIGRLQELLERVQTRAAAPRGNGAAFAAAAQPAHVEEAPVLADAAPETPSYVESAVSASTHPSEAPATTAESYDYDVDVEVSTEVVEVDIDIDEPEPMESGAQAIGQSSMPPDELEEVHESLAPAPIEEREEEVVQVAAPLANEIEEPAPSSSRRPIAGEEPAAEAYEAESAPRHTPPPESGKQVSAAPSNHPPARGTSVPPPSLEGHTLIGGWREPGLAPQIGMPGTGLRVPGPPAASEPPAAAAAAPAQVSGTRLTPDVTEPQLADAAGVAAFVGAPAAPRPTTLGELLDMTLSL